MKHAEPADLRAAMRTFATGVTIVTTIVDGHVHGFTANAFTSVSLDPPSVLLCVNRRAKSHALITAAQRFCVNILRVDQQGLAEYFARSGDESQFASVAWEPTPSGLPKFRESLAWLDCEVGEEHSVATHTIYVANVLAAHVSEGAPLGYFDGTFADFHVARTTGSATPRVT